MDTNHSEMDKVMKVASFLDRHPDMTKEELKDLMDIAACMADRMEEPAKETVKERFFHNVWRKLFR
mgnify:CR=1 FL=1